MNTITKKITNDTVQNRHFNKVYDRITNKIEFDASWNNGTGYFDGAARNVKLAPSTFAKSYCDKSKRKLLMLGTRFGTVVVFERYTDGADGTFVGNVPVKIKQMELQAIPDGRLGYDHLWAIFGFWSDDSKYTGHNNLSDHIEKLASMFSAA